jgi:hypothetical protein
MPQSTAPLSPLRFVNSLEGWIFETGLGLQAKGVRFGDPGTRTLAKAFMATTNEVRRRSRFKATIARSNVARNAILWWLVLLSLSVFGRVKTTESAGEPDRKGTNFRFGSHGNYPASRPVEPDAGVKQRISNAYSRIPISFEKNEGQTDPRVAFLSRRPGYTLFLSAGGEAALALSGSASARVDGLHSFRSAKVTPTHATPADIASNGRTSQRDTAAALIVTPVGANKKAHAVGQEALPGTVNYFRGSDPTKWRTNLSTYARVSYENVYPGVDLVYYGNERQLEYDFIVHPGADPGIIDLDFQGADELSVDPQGDLVVKIAGREVRQCRPLIYQEDGSVRHEIAGSYTLTGKRTVRFRLSAYDATKPLVIDPVLVYSTYVGGAGVDIANDIAVDAAGSAYVTGNTEFSVFPTTPGAFDTTFSAGGVFVTKLNVTGNALVYSTFLGGGEGNGIALDAVGNAYVTGTSGPNFPTTAGAFDTSWNGGGDVFVTKLNVTGAALIYSTYLGSGGTTQAPVSHSTPPAMRM